MGMTSIRWLIPAIGVLTAIGQDSDVRASAAAWDPRGCRKSAWWAAYKNADPPKVEFWEGDNLKTTGIP